jgi:hypothetical protein
MKKWILALTLLLLATGLSTGKLLAQGTKFTCVPGVDRLVPPVVLFTISPFFFSQVPDSYYASDARFTLYGSSFKEMLSKTKSEINRMRQMHASGYIYNLNPFLDADYSKTPEYPKDHLVAKELMAYSHANCVDHVYFQAKLGKLVSHDTATNTIHGLEKADLDRYEHNMRVLAEFARVHDMKGVFLQSENYANSLWSPECKLNPATSSCEEKDTLKPYPPYSAETTQQYLALGRAVARGFRLGFPKGQLVIGGGGFDSDAKDRCHLPKPDLRYWPCSASPLAHNLTHEADFYAGMILENVDANEPLGLKNGATIPSDTPGRNVIFASNGQFVTMPDMGSYQFIPTALETQCPSTLPCNQIKDDHGRIVKTMIPASVGGYDSWRRQTGINPDLPGINHDEPETIPGNWVLRALADPKVDPKGNSHSSFDMMFWGGIGFGFAPYNYYQSKTTVVNGQNVSVFHGPESCKFKTQPPEACPLLAYSNHFAPFPVFFDDTPAGIRERHAQAVDSMVSMAQFLMHMRYLRSLAPLLEAGHVLQAGVDIQQPRIVWLYAENDQWMADSLKKKFKYTCVSLDGGIAPNPLNLPCPGLVLRATYPSRATSDK